MKPGMSSFKSNENIRKKKVDQIIDSAYRALSAKLRMPGYNKRNAG